MGGHAAPPSGALRRAIQVRDRHCQHPSGCDEPADRCDVDHTVPVSQNGRTDQFGGRTDADVGGDQGVLDRLPGVLVEPVTTQQGQQATTQGALRSGQPLAEPDQAFVYPFVDFPKGLPIRVQRTQGASVVVTRRLVREVVDPLMPPPSVCAARPEAS